MAIASLFGIAGLAAIVATILAFVFIVPDKKREGLNKFGKFLHDTANFKYLIIEKILQAMYIFSTAYVFLLGFCMLFYVQEGYGGRYYSTPDVWYGGYGLAVMVFGPILVRLVYEGIMMLILLVKNVIQINNKLGAGAEGQKETPAAPVDPVAPVRTTPAAPVRTAPVQATPVAPAQATPAAPVQNVQKVFCTNCGNELSATDEFCTTCGKRMR